MGDGQISGGKPWEREYETPKMPWEKFREDNAPQSGITEQEKPNNPFVEAGKIIAPAIAPTVLGAAGATAGIASHIPGAPTTLESMGSGLGEVINQRLGVTPESKGQVALAMGVPPLFRAISRLGKLGVRYIARMSGAEQALAINKAHELITGRIMNPDSSAALYQAAERAGNPTVMFPSLRQEITKLAGDEAKVKRMAPSLVDSELSTLYKELEKSTKKGATLSDVRATMTRIGQKIAGYGEEASQQRGAFKDIYKSILDDATNPANVVTKSAAEKQAVSAWREASLAHKREIVQAELTDHLTTKAISFKQTGEMSLNANSMLNYIKNNREDLVKRLGSTGKQEINDIEVGYRELAKIRPLPVRPGVPIGSGRKLGQAAFGTAVGGPAGAFAVLEAGELLNSAMQSSAGRRLAVNLLKRTGGVMDESVAGVLGGFLRGAFGQDIYPAPSVTSDHILGTPLATPTPPQE